MHEMYSRSSRLNVCDYMFNNFNNIRKCGIFLFYWIGGFTNLHTARIECICSSYLADWRTVTRFIHGVGNSWYLYPEIDVAERTMCTYDAIDAQLVYRQSRNSNRSGKGRELNAHRFTHNARMCSCLLLSIVILSTSLREKERGQHTRHKSGK